MLAQDFVHLVSHAFWMKLSSVIYLQRAGIVILATVIRSFSVSQLMYERLSLQGSSGRQGPSRRWN